MSARLMADVTLHAGGGWEGHVFFLVKHPITQEQLSTNSFGSVRKFCEKHQLQEDPEIVEFLTKLEYSEKYGWLVPKQYLDARQIVTSAYNYLKEIQK